MDSMFYFADDFDQNLGNWDISNVASMSSMFAKAGLSTENYDALLLGLGSQSVQADVDFSGGDSLYSASAATARQSLIDDHGWIISDGGLE